MLQKRIAFQGEPGAYSEEAGYGYCPTADMVPCETFDAVFEAVRSGACESGLIPIENSLAGSIHQNYDLLLRHQLFIVGEYYLRVRHCLIGQPDGEISTIKSAISHPQALGQCAGYLRELGIHPEPVYDTAGSVKLLKGSGDLSKAAIASKRAAKIYGMKILQESIEDNPQNFTRFLEISRDCKKPEDNERTKTSIVFTVKHQPGTLYRAMGVFALRNIDLMKIESRPLVGRAWEYLFYVDFIGAAGIDPGITALKELKNFALMVRVLGSYPLFDLDRST
jgi:prephenate dehydratase